MKPRTKEGLLARDDPDASRDAVEIVARKLAQFARSRRELAQAMARRRGADLPDEVERFFAAVESGHWEEIEAVFKRINGGDSSTGHSPGRPPEVDALWPAIIDAFGVAEQVHEWPPQQLLDYGNAVLGALRPGMIYVGGTDNGRWIPELLNETSAGERHVIVTQNGLADNSYLDYLRLQYEDHLSLPTSQDAERIFQEYLTDARKRFEHDQEFPDQPKQVRPGEDFRSGDGRFEVSGSTAVMAINEKLLTRMMDLNPDRSFGLQESFPLRGTYADAVPLGPLMELRAKEDAAGFTPERATAALEYWQNAARDARADPVTAASPSALKSYSHDAASAANLLAAHDYGSQAEQAYRLASGLWPENPEATAALAQLLERSGRADEGRKMREDFARNYPDQRAALERLEAGIKVIMPAPNPSPTTPSP